MSNVTKSNAYNWAGGGPQSAMGTPLAAPTRLFKYKSFKGGAKKDTTDDEGHTGSRNKLQGVDVTGGSSAPNIEDVIRPDEIIGDLIRGLLGSCDTSRWLTTAAYKHTFEESEDGDLPPLGFFQGYNVGSGEDGKPKRFDDCIVSKMDFKFSTKETPSFTAETAGNLPIFGVTEPTLVYATPRIPPLLAPQLRVYWDPIGGEDPIGTTLMAGFMEGDVSVDNKIETDRDQDADFGVTRKDMGGLELGGGFKRRHIDTDLQRQFITGSPTGTTPIETNEEGMLRYEVTGGMIKEASGTPTIYPYIFRLDILNAIITENEPTEEGDGPKTYDLKWKAIPDETNTSVSAFLQNKVTTYAPV